MTELKESVTAACRDAKEASRELSGLSSAVKDRALKAVTEALLSRKDEILAANQLDMQAGQEAGLESSLLDRLMLNSERVGAMAEGVSSVASLVDPVGEQLEGHRLPNGLDVRKVRVPLGVVAVVYEGRPNVTIDAAALCIKSGNAAVLRGSSSAKHSNAVLAGIAAEACVASGLPQATVTLIGGGDRAELAELATQDRYIDLIVPRGGEGLKKALSDVATVPVIYAASGNCHIYVDAEADLKKAQAITVNAKVQRPGVCNAAETLLVHRAVAEEFLPAVFEELTALGVELRVSEQVKQAVIGSDFNLLSATEADWESEFLDLVLAVKVVDSVDEAIDHINRYGSGHSEAVVSESYPVTKEFQRRVDAACVYVNASTRFTDGGEFGMGAEIGNSTQKLHARGPIGLRELCSYKYLVEGTGQVRS